MTQENSIENNDNTLHQELFHVVKNDEEQYSIWPSYKEIPSGWTSVGEAQPKDECLAYIDKNWTDMRPLSLKKQMGDS